MKTHPSLEKNLPYELTLTFVRPVFDQMYYIKHACDANAFLRLYINKYRLDLKENFWAILMTSANRVIGVSQVASGSTRGVQINPKEILQLVLMSNAVHVIISHNHPAGTLKFSASDIRQTKKLQRLTKLMEVTLLDHIVITSESFASMVQEDLL